MAGSLTILVPVYNEADCLESLHQEMNKFLSQTAVPTSVLFINDGSSDHSEAAIEEMCAMDSRYAYISLQRNCGLSTALKAGIDHCESDFIGYMDADLQTSPEDFLKLIEFMNDYDLVTGYRLNRKDSAVKKLSSLIANSFRRWLLEDDIIDNCCPLKIIRSDIARRIPFFDGMHRFIPDLVMLLNGSVRQVPVRHFPRYAGKAKYHLTNRLIGPLIDTFAFRWMQRNMIRYNVRKESCRKAEEHGEYAA